MVFRLFGKKETPIRSDEYIDLLKRIEKIAVEFESLKLNVELYKKKLKVKSKLLEEEEEDKSKDLYNGILLKE